MCVLSHVWRVILEAERASAHLVDLRYHSGCSLPTSALLALLCSWLAASWVCYSRASSQSGPAAKILGYSLTGGECINRYTKDS